MSTRFLIGAALAAFALVAAALDVGTIEPFHVLAIEHGGHRLDGRELVLDLIEQ